MDAKQANSKKMYYCKKQLNEEFEYVRLMWETGNVLNSKGKLSTWITLSDISNKNPAENRVATWTQWLHDAQNDTLTVELRDIPPSG